MTSARLDLFTTRVRPKPCICLMDIAVVSEVRFLDTKVTTHGQLLPWRTSFNALFHRVHSALTDAGLGAYPSDLVAGLGIKVLPAVLYGCELWGLRELAKVALGTKSPCLSDGLALLLAQVKLHTGLPAGGFNAAVYQLCQIPSLRSCCLA